MSRFGIRRRLLLTVVAAIAVAVAALVTGFNLVLARTLDREASTLARTRAAAQLATLRAENGKLTIGEAPDEATTDAYVWVFAGGTVLEHPRASVDAGRAARILAAGPARFRDVSSSDTRLYAVPVLDAGKRVGTVVAGVSLAPYEETRRTALVASLVFGGLVLVLVALVARWLLAASLRPVVRMTRQAAAWSERDLDHRFALGTPHDELTELAATLDGLLDRLAASLRRERRFSAELSHELRTPLARILAESELALSRVRRPDDYRAALELVHRSAGQLARTVEALVAAARYEAGDRGSADAETVAAGAAAGCAAVAEARGVVVEIAEAERPLRIGVDLDLAERILHPVLENACRHSAAHVGVSIARAGSAVAYTVEDDGPGVPQDELERIFEPGVRGSRHRPDGASGAGLGLALARRLARSVEGDVTAVHASSGGRFVIRLPSG